MMAELLEWLRNLLGILAITSRYAAVCMSFGGAGGFLAHAFGYSFPYGFISGYCLPVGFLYFWFGSQKQMEKEFKVLDDWVTKGWIGKGEADRRKRELIDWYMVRRVGRVSRDERGRGPSAPVPENRPPSEGG